MFLKPMTGRAFTLIELLMVILLVAILGALSIPIYVNLADEAKQASEESVVGLVRSGIGIYYSESYAKNRTPIYPATLDSASDGLASIENPFFGTILSMSITTDWQKSGLSYTGPAGNIYTYDPVEGTFAIASGESDNFDDGESEGWIETGNWWDVIDGKYYGGRPGGGWCGENRTFFGEESWQNYRVELDANLQNGHGYGVYFRAQDPSSLDAYIFQYDPGWGRGAFLFRKIVGGREMSPLAVVLAPDGYNWRNEEKHITVDVSGDNYKFYVSDISGGTTPILDVTDDSYSEGSMGLRTWARSYASFDNVEITQIQ